MKKRKGFILLGGLLEVEFDLLYRDGWKVKCGLDCIEVSCLICFNARGGIRMINF